MILQETILLGQAVVRIELDDRLRYRLSYGEDIVYENGRRTVRGRGSPYEFRSVEKLRYAFERDVEARGGRLAWGRRASHRRRARGARPLRGCLEPPHGRAQGRPPARAFAARPALAAAH